MKIRTIISTFGILALALARSAGKENTSGAVDFSRDIRPLLSENCFTCHGPDEKGRKAKLRLDTREGAFAKIDGRSILVAGDSAKSELFKHVSSTDPDEVMPPPKTGKKLAPKQIDLLKRWIDQGANWQVHWAYEAPKRAPEPEVKRKNWARNPIDKFVLARLEKENLKPSPEADRITLIRRASLDLTGLPPTPEEVDAYLNDKSTDAYERVIDRLLASPRFGEHMAKYWMDATRYADSHGYHIDSQRDIWAYREWVVKAFNKNLPFDEFTVEQLAGDLLPEATRDQKIASGYVRCNMSTGEGGAIEAEYQAKYGFDRVETTGTIWLGLTLVCSRCHTHKYDPIQQREYYGMVAFFNSLNESVMDGNKPNPDPFLKLPTPQQTARLEWLTKHVKDGQEKLDAPMPEIDAAQVAWVNRWHDRLSAGWATLAPSSARSLVVSNGAFLRTLEDKTVLADGSNPESDSFELRLQPQAGIVAALRLETLPHDSLPKKSAARAEDGRFRLSEFEAELITRDAEGKAQAPKKLKFSQAVADAFEPKFEAANAIDGKADTGWGVAADAINEPHTALFVLSEPLTVPEKAELKVTLRYEASKSKRAIGHFRIAAAQNDEMIKLLNPPRFEPWQAIGPFEKKSMTHGFTNVYEPETLVDLGKKYMGVREEIKWNAKGDFDDGKSHQLVSDLHGVHGVYYLYRTLRVPAARKLDVQLRADDLFKLWVNGRLVAERSQPEKPGEGPLKATVELQQGENKFLVKVVNHQGACNFQFDKDLNEADSVPADIAAVLATTKKLTGPQEAKVKVHYRREHSPAYKALADDMTQWREEQSGIEREIPTTIVAKEMEKPRDTTMLMRGEYDKIGDKVPHAVPSILPPLPPGAPTNRLGLAKWLVDPSHPLTARVTVNRFWQQYFGLGIVKTSDDFGVQGDRPSHPELLDWLATEFIRTGWDIKGMQRLIVTSATYRQSSKASAEARARDPENRLLARASRFRADGEVVRDMALFISGLLVEHEGGRSVKPFQPAGLWEAVSFNNSQKYVPETGEGQYRRSLYTYWKRQSPPPDMLIFDAPTREYCTVRRPRTNTPLQALTLMNDIQFVEASRSFANRMLKNGGATMDSRIIYGFRLATGRKPTSDEQRVLKESLQAQLAEFGKDRAAAEKLLSVGAFHADDHFDKAELAAWSTLASLLLNLDETITKS